MKLLRTIRFDDTDNHVFGTAAAPGEWAISGAFAFSQLDPEALAGKDRQRFRNGWLGLTSFARATFVTVAKAEAGDLTGCCNILARHFIDVYGAPGQAEAQEAARAEMQFTEEFCRDVPINTLFSVLREFDEQAAIHEEFSIIEPPGGHVHTRVWQVEEDDG